MIFTNAIERDMNEAPQQKNTTTKSNKQHLKKYISNEPSVSDAWVFAQSGAQCGYLFSTPLQIH